MVATGKFSTDRWTKPHNWCTTLTYSGCVISNTAVNNAGTWSCPAVTVDSTFTDITGTQTFDSSTDEMTVSAITNTGNNQITICLVCTSNYGGGTLYAPIRVYI